MTGGAIKNLGGQYQCEFRDDIEPAYTTNERLSEEIVRKISAAKDEPKWMLDIRLAVYRAYRKLSLPNFGPDLTKLNYGHINYFRRNSDLVAYKWEDIPEDIKKTFDKLEVPQAEWKYLAGPSARYESEIVCHNVCK